jgi:hypothetical protein
MNGTVLLHIAAVFENNASPIATKGGTRSDIAILSNDHIAGDGGKRVNKRGFVYHGLISFKCIDHGSKVGKFVQEKGLRRQELGIRN